MSEEIKLTGTIKFYNFQKAYGFIELPGSELDYFFHAVNLANSWLPEKGDKVTFFVGQNTKGVCATNVEKVDVK